MSSGLLDAAAHKTRGVAVWDNFVYRETDDAHLLCLDARSGNLRWEVEYADKTKHYGATSVPLVVNGNVIVGTSGGDSGVRGFIAAYGDWCFLAMMLGHSRLSKPRRDVHCAISTQARIFYASPMTYAVGDNQYVAIAAGSDVFSFALPPI